METALTGDVAILRAWKVDKAGNCVFRYVLPGLQGAQGMMKNLRH